jgi:hypothetical protein
MVYVSGDSTAATSQLGTVNWDEADSFVTLDFDLIATSTPTNATPDVFSLGIEVPACPIRHDPGRGAGGGAGADERAGGHLAPAHGRDRQLQQGCDQPVARAFYDRGDYSPEFDNSNFGPGGNFDYERSTAAPKGRGLRGDRRVLAGPAGGKSRAKAKLEDPGIASAKSRRTPGACTAPGSRPTASTWMRPTAG